MATVTPASDGDSSRTPSIRSDDEWLVGLAGWVIQDGNYEDFEVGSSRRFALEIYTPDPNGPPVSNLVRRLVEHVGDHHYEINAEVAFASDDLLMLDFGLLAYRELRERPALASGWRAGTVSLGVDPFFYFEGYAKRLEVPPAIYSWDITGLWRQSAPFIASNIPGARQVMVRDEERLGWMWLGKTDAWADDDGSAEYLIRARLRPEAPSRDIHRR
jgi:hypothetical protein